MKVHFATSNAGKVKNAQDALARFGIVVVQVEIDLVESRSEDPAVIAMEKAQQAYRDLQKPVIVEDSGFFIDALGGFPMTHIKFSLKTLGVKNIMKMLEGEENRHAEWRMTLAFAYGEGKFESFTFVEKGEIAKEVRPAMRQVMSEYWRIFIPKILRSDNALALSELVDEDLAAWRNYYAEHNQFMMFGGWFSKQSRF